MKNPSIIFICALVILMSCTKSNEVHPEQGDGFNEIITVGLDSVNVKYFRADFDELDQIRFKYWYHLAPDTAEAIMERNDSFFELCLNDLLGDTLYYYRYVLYPGAIVEEIKQFHTQAYDAPEPPTISLPIVNTVDVTEITANSAICGGVVANDGGATVSDRGVCWSVVENPSLSDSYVSAGPGMGSFTVLMDGLGTNTTYHVRAYAVNEKGTAYGLDKVFVTGNDVPVGAISGLFTINVNGDQIYFSQGNLQYQASTNTWRFAEKQWDFVGGIYNGSEYGTVYENGEKCDNSLISPAYDGWIDLFGWGTSGWDNGNVYYRPYDYEQLSGWNAACDYGYGYGPTDGLSPEYDLTGIYANADWGVYNSISNGGNMQGQWRTMTVWEWYYLCSRPNTLSGILFAKAIVNGVNGVIFLPDNWNAAYYDFNYPNRPDAPFTINEIMAEDWAFIEENGAVFLPVAGFRFGTSFNLFRGQYQSVTRHNPEHQGEADYFMIANENVTAGQFGGNRSQGLSVRLVQDANK